MASGTLSITAAIGTHIYSTNYADTGGGTERHDVTLPAGLSGSAAWGASSAVITLATGHGLTTANKVAVAWPGGVRIGMTISAYDGTTITVTNSTGTGTSLPTTSTATAIVGNAVDCADISFDGDNAKFLLVTCDQLATINFLDSGPVSLLSKYVGPTAGYYWSYLSGVAAPITGNAVADAKVYNHSTTAATLTVSVVLAT